MAVFTLHDVLPQCSSVLSSDPFTYNNKSTKCPPPGTLTKYRDTSWPRCLRTIRKQAAVLGADMSVYGRLSAQPSTGCGISTAYELTFCRCCARVQSNHCLCEMALVRMNWIITSNVLVRSLCVITLSSDR